MSTVISSSREPLARPGAPASRRRAGRAEAAVALVAFAALCLAVLTRSTHLLEPDDYAYRASIVALTEGHIALSDAQYTALLRRFSTSAQPGIAQWVHLANGTWISEKNPGYPFFAAPFQIVGLLRLAPLFYGGLGCLGLFLGARRWLGRWGGASAVILFCSSAAAIVFSARATMPTFTDASLIAAGTGALLWTLLAIEAPARRRLLVGLLAFASLEGATAIRYTNVVFPAVAVAAVLLVRRRARLTPRQLAWWLGSVALLVAALAAFDAAYYGGVTRTGYATGEITFSLAALAQNLAHMPAHLVSSMPLILLALVAGGWIAVRLVRSRRPGASTSARRSTDRLDGAVGAALIASGGGIYGLYATYTWTASLSANPGSTVQVVRFYLPALAALALLGAWLVTHLPRSVTVATVAVALALGAATYPALADGRLAGPGGAGGPPGQGQPAGPPAGGLPPGGLAPGGPPPGGSGPGGPPPGGFGSGGPPPSG